MNPTNRTEAYTQSDSSKVLHSRKPPVSLDLPFVLAAVNQNWENSDIVPKESPIWENSQFLTALFSRPQRVDSGSGYLLEPEFNYEAMIASMPAHALNNELFAKNIIQRFPLEINHKLMENYKINNPKSSQDLYLKKLFTSSEDKSFFKKVLSNLSKNRNLDTNELPHKIFIDFIVKNNETEDVLFALKTAFSKGLRTACSIDLDSRQLNEKKLSNQNSGRSFIESISDTLSGMGGMLKGTLNRTNGSNVDKKIDKKKNNNHR